jgi:nucleoside-diphosphate kinase
MADEATLVIVKPDAVRRGLTGEILARIERKGLRIAEMRMMRIERDLAERHYGEHEDKPFFDALVEFVTRSPSLLLVVEGPEGTVAMVRGLMGATDPADAAAGTIRGDLATAVTENLVHGSDSTDSAKREIALFFPDL